MSSENFEETNFPFFRIEGQIMVEGFKQKLIKSYERICEIKAHKLDIIDPQEMVTKDDFKIKLELVLEKNEFLGYEVNAIISIQDLKYCKDSRANKFFGFCESRTAWQKMEDVDRFVLQRDQINNYMGNKCCVLGFNRIGDLMGFYMPKEEKDIYIYLNVGYMKGNAQTLKKGSKEYKKLKCLIDTRSVGKNRRVEVRREILKNISTLSSSLKNMVVEDGS